MTEEANDPGTANGLKIIGSLIMLGGTVAIVAGSGTGVFAFAFGMLLLVCGRFTE